MYAEVVRVRSLDTPPNLATIGATRMLPRPAASVLRAPVLLLRRRVHASASPFELLGLSSSATPLEIKEAYRYVGNTLDTAWVPARPKRLIGRGWPRLPVGWSAIWR